ncbi:hypothetical protein BH09PLA1_BH09PLA1_37530 [soil metagenome]
MRQVIHNFSTPRADVRRTFRGIFTNFPKLRFYLLQKWESVVNIPKSSNRRGKKTLWNMQYSLESSNFRLMRKDAF